MIKKSSISFLEAQCNLIDRTTINEQTYSVICRIINNDYFFANRSRACIIHYNRRFSQCRSCITRCGWLIHKHACTHTACRQFHNLQAIKHTLRECEKELHVISYIDRMTAFNFLQINTTLQITIEKHVFATQKKFLNNVSVCLLRNINYICSIAVL